MNKKKVFVVIAVLLVALVSMSSIIYASHGESEIVAQSSNETQPGEAEADEKPVRYMFVQSAHSGSFVPVEGEMNYTLTLEGVSPQTIAFSDRPERVVGQVSMQKFLDGLGFSPKNPPNAAIEILEGEEEEDVMVMELLDPVYDATNQTLQYNVSILEESNHSYATFNERHDKSLPEHFGPAALFIDSCPDCRVICNTNKGSNGCYGWCTSILIGQCWKWEKASCEPCYSKSHYEDMCAGNPYEGCDNCLTFDSCGGW